MNNKFDDYHLFDVFLQAIYHDHNYSTGPRASVPYRIDVADWRRNTEYIGYNNLHPGIEVFWAAIQGLTNQQRTRLVEFVTGSTCLPREGFAGLRRKKYGGFRFCIEKREHPNELPRLV